VDGDEVTVLTEPGDLDRVRAALGTRFEILDAENTMMPTTSVDLDAKHVSQVMKLIERLDELDDVQRVHTNTEFTDDALAEFEAAASR